VRRLPPQLLAVAAIVSVQFGSSWARTFFEATTSLGAAALRLFFGSILLALVVRPRVSRWDRGTWLRVVGLGLALGGMNSFIYLAIDRVPIGVAVTIEFLGPLGVAVVQTRRWADAAWALLALAGVVLLGLEGFDGRLDVVGLALAAAAAVFWAAYILTSASLGGRARGVEPLAGAMIVAALVVVPFGAGPATRSVIADPWLLGIFLLVAILTSVLPYSFEFVALKRMPSRVFGVFSSLGPAVAALAGFVVLREALATQQLVALVFVVAASIGVTVFAAKPNLDVL
jgi:inner membrane transporter RhtA